MASYNKFRRNTNDEAAQALWNADDERLKVIIQLMAMFENAIINKNIESMYIYLRSLKRHANGAIEDERQKEIDKRFDEITKLKNKMNNIYRIKELFSEFYYQCENLFEYIDASLVEGGYYFRRKKVPEGL